MLASKCCLCARKNILTLFLSAHILISPNSNVENAMKQVLSNRSVYVLMRDGTTARLYSVSEYGNEIRYRLWQDGCMIRAIWGKKSRKPFDVIEIDEA